MSTIECPRCGYDFRAITPDTAGIRPTITPGSVVETEEVSILEDEVRRLNSEIVSLNEARASLLRRINNARSKTRHIPPELLSTIFQFVSNPVDFMRFLPSDSPWNGMKPYSNLDDLSRCKMTTVSHSWRQAASSNPQLWSSLSLRVYSPIINANLSLFDRFSRNAGSLPMSIELDFRKLATRSSLPENRYNVSVSHHCDSLAIVRPSYHRRPVKAHLDLTELPRLRHVVLIQVLCPFSLPSTITTLQLRAIPTDISLKLLVTCPRLVKFEHHETKPADERIENVTNVNEPVTIEKLEYLAWSIDYGIWSPRICRGFTFLRFSRLRTLHWSDDIGHKYCDQRRMENNWRLITKFFCHLPTTLSSLTFIRCSYSIEDSLQLLGAIPHLSELHFIDCRVRCVQPVVEAIGRPISQLEQEAIDISTSSDQTLLPNLSHFSLTVTQTTLLNESMGGYIFVDMLEAIHNSGKGQGRFKLSLNHPVSWNENDLDRMRMLESSGFSLELDQAN
ncbi:hypothetical protein Agabi119p4_6668 [Agaricus bisporus var. burnettii]|uniref:F-box domain-containing protein n=1 Tax=Agaricus bisporus var. burnettii TaxID=192524 RepID=A0A8H7EZZ6_AGABI|nr:hypothetical protein Agabi119p4_6668 [Agaricus bisporus var. burnettii]